MTLFISCPDASVQCATAFSMALGWTQDAEMSGADTSCFAIAPEQYVMLASREMYAGVGGTDHPPRSCTSVSSTTRTGTTGRRSG